MSFTEMPVASETSAKPLFSPVHFHAIKTHFTGKVSHLKQATLKWPIKNETAL